MALLSNKFKMKSGTWLALTLAGMTTMGLQAAELSEKRLSNLEKDMNIMGRILQTTLEQESESRDRPRIEGVYLANQGMLFSVENRGGFHFEFKNFHMPAIAPVVVAPPVNVQVEVDNENEFIIIQEEAIEAAEEAMELAEESIERISEYGWNFTSKSERNEQREVERALRKEQRVLETKARSIEREVRDIERKLRDAEFEDELAQSKENSEKRAELKKEMETLSQKLNGIAKLIQEKSAEIQKRAAEVKQKQIAKQKEQLAKLEASISQVVCDFGPGLRSLPKGQNITFSIEGHEKNQIYVFGKKDIDKCGDGDITSTKLLESAIKYAM